jgi:hypothetical protein
MNREAVGGKRSSKSVSRISGESIGYSADPLHRLLPVQQFPVTDCRGWGNALGWSAGCGPILRRHAAHCLCRIRHVDDLWACPYYLSGHLPGPDCLHPSFLHSLGVATSFPIYTSYRRSGSFANGPAMGWDSQRDGNFTLSGDDRFLCMGRFENLIR